MEKKDIEKSTNPVYQVASEFLDVGLVTVLGGIIGYLIGEITQPSGSINPLEMMLLGNGAGYCVGALKAYHELKQYINKKL